MRAILSSFDNFMAVFVATFAVVWSTLFMPLLGGPLHPYEAQAIGAGWQSIRSGQATNISEAFEAATSLPVEAVFPSAHAEPVPLQLVAAEPAPDPLELLGGPGVDAPAPTIVASTRPAARRVAAPRVTLPAVEPVIEIVAGPALVCDIPAVKQGLCEPAEPAAAAATG